MGTEFTQVLDSLGWAVLHSVWQGIVAFLFVILWRAALRGRSPALRHAGQIAALLGCLAAFVWTFATYLGLPNLASVSGATLSATNMGEAPQVLTGLMAPFDPAAAQASVSLSRITPILACLWALGFAVMSLRYAFAFGQVQQLRSIGVQRPDNAWTERFMQLARDIGVSSKVRLLVSANVKGPMTLGLFKPVVLVPVGFLTGLPADQVEAILRHELAHIRRYDYGLNLIQTAVKTVLFYHPAIHIICRWADQDREQACDDLAVKQGRDPLCLARGLAALRLQNHPAFGMAATGSGNDMPLMDRLTRLAGHAPKRGRPEHILMSVLSAILLGSVYLGASSRAEAHPVPPALPDTIITVDSELPVAPVPPMPPMPPVLMKMDLSELETSGAMQSFINSDKAAYRAFAKEMKQYEAELDEFLKSSNFGEDEREVFSEFYADLADDISGMFEDRRETIEELYEEQVERQMELQEDKIERLAELQSLESKAEGLYSDDCIACAKRKSEAKATQIKANKQVEKEIERARAEKQKRKARADTEINRPSQKRHQEFRNMIMREFLKDGIIKSSKQTVTLSHPNGTMIVNGKTLPKSLKGKYCSLWDEYGFMDGQSEVTITPDSMTLLTDWKNGQHKTRVTYGTFKTSH